jgi:D-3-phosphoglycerate dehydrogenase
MHVLFADAIDRSAVDSLAGLGHEVTYEPSLTADELANHLTGVDVLVVRSTKVPETALRSRLQRARPQCGCGGGAHDRSAVGS